MKLLILLSSLLFLSLPPSPIKEYHAELDPFFCIGCDGEFAEYGGWCVLYCGIGFINVTSSNELKDSTGINYNGRNAHDFNLSTAWAVAFDSNTPKAIINLNRILIFDLLY